MKFSFDTISIALNTNIACSDVFQGHTRGIYPQAIKSKT